MATLTERIEKLEQVVGEGNLTLTSKNGKNKLELVVNDDIAGVYVETDKHISSLIAIDMGDSCYGGLVTYLKPVNEDSGASACFTVDTENIAHLQGALGSEMFISTVAEIILGKSLDEPVEQTKDVVTKPFMKCR